MARGSQKVRFGGDCEGFLQLPRDKAPASAVVVLHERYGLVQHTLDLAQRLAREGYVAMAPNLFSRWRGDAQELDWQVFDLQPRPMQEMMRALGAPALLVFGERDHLISLDHVRRVRDALEEARRSYRMKVFADMPHGFLNDTMPGRYR